MLEPALELLRQGGSVMIPIVVLSCVLYHASLRLLIELHRSRRRLRHPRARSAPAAQVQLWQYDLRELFRSHRQLIGVLIVAAPLLGLLGTVMGMISTFESLATPELRGSTQGLARGISMALVTTEAGLAVAIPAVLMLYYAQRQMQKALQELIALEQRVTGREVAAV